MSSLHIQCIIFFGDLHRGAGVWGPVIGAGPPGAEASGVWLPKASGIPQFDAFGPCSMDRHVISATRPRHHFHLHHHQQQPSPPRPPTPRPPPPAVPAQGTAMSHCHWHSGCLVLVAQLDLLGGAARAAERRCGLGCCDAPQQPDDSHQGQGGGGAGYERRATATEGSIGSAARPAE